MDPTACFRAIRDAFDDDDYGEAALRALDLIQWFDRGGFPPTVGRDDWAFIAAVLYDHAADRENRG